MSITEQVTGQRPTLQVVTIGLTTTALTMEAMTGLQVMVSAIQTSHI